MRVLYCGQLWKGGTCRERAAALRARGWHVDEFDTTRYLRSGGAILGRIQHRTIFGPAVSALNRDLLAAVSASARPDVIWIDKGTWVFASTVRMLKKITASIVVHYTPDPAFTVHKSRHFREALPTYDVCVTTKRYELDLYKLAGAQDVVFNLQGVDNKFPQSDAASEISSPRRSGCTFIGHREAHYEKLLAHLADRAIPLSIWGPSWESISGRDGALSGCVRGGPVWGDEYLNRLTDSRIGIGLLSKLCADQFTTRSFEIPAAGSMLLAERTKEHMELFAEGREAEFFSSPAELVEKARFYLENEAERASIAASGRARALSSYTWDAVLDCTCEHIRSLVSR